MTPAERALAAWIDRQLADAPPLPPAAARRIAGLLTGAGGRRG